MRRSSYWSDSTGYRLDVLETGDRLAARVPLRSDRIADLHVCRSLQARYDVAHVAGAKLFAGMHLQLQYADLVGRILAARIEQFDALALAERAVEYSVISDNSAERIEHRVENQRLKRSLFVAFRGRNPLYDRFEHLLDSLTRLARSGQNAVGIATEQVDDLILDLVDHGRIHIDLVHDGHDLQIVIQRQIKVRDSLRLNTLRRVDHEQRALARGDRTGYLVRKIDMPRSIDQVQHVLLALVDIFHLDRVALDRDSLFALEVHIVQHLSLQFALRKRLGRFEQAIGKRTLAVIDMRYDTEIADILHTFLLFVRKVS